MASIHTFPHFLNVHQRQSIQFRQSTCNTFTPARSRTEYPDRNTHPQQEPSQPTRDSNSVTVRYQTAADSAWLFIGHSSDVCRPAWRRHRRVATDCRRLRRRFFCGVRGAPRPTRPGAMPPCPRLTWNTEKPCQRTAARAHKMRVR